MKNCAAKLWRWENGSAPRRFEDELAGEEPLEIRVDNHSIAVTMRTPGEDDELAAGFLVSEGIIRRPDQILKIAPHPLNRRSNVLNVFLSPEVAVDLSRLTRHVFASSSCGLCGKATIAAIHQQFPKIKGKIKIEAHVVLQLSEKLRRAQETFARTGGLHAAAVFDLRGKLIVLREDVGRHNAVDKVIGYGLRHELLPFSRHILMVSGRASFEIIQKALAAGVGIVCAVSAPSSLAVEFARASGQTLIGFLRGERMNVYTHHRRIRFQ